MSPPATALLVPALDADALVTGWRRRLDPAAVQGVPAHITLLYPFLAPEALTDAVQVELAGLFGATPAFGYTLARTKRLAGLLMLDPQPAAPFEALRERILARWPLVPYGGRYGSRPPMHLSIAYGADAAAAGEALWPQIEAELAPHLPLPMRATEAWLVVRRDDVWRLRRSYTLGR